MAKEKKQRIGTRKKKKKKDATTSTPLDPAKRFRIPEFSISPVDDVLIRKTKTKGRNDCSDDDKPPAKRRRIREEQMRDKGESRNDDETDEADVVREALKLPEDIEHLERDRLSLPHPESHGDDGVGKELLESTVSESPAKDSDADDTSGSESPHREAEGSPSPQEESGSLSPVPVPPEEKEKNAPDEEWREWVREAELRMEGINKQMDSDEESSDSLSSLDESKIKTWDIKDFIKRNVNEIIAEYDARSSSLIPPKIDLINRWKPVKKTVEQKLREKQLIGLNYCIGRRLGFLHQYGRISSEDIDDEKDRHDPEELRELLKTRPQVLQGGRVPSLPLRHQQRRKSRRHPQREKTPPVSTRSSISPMSTQPSPQPSTSRHRSSDPAKSDKELDRLRGQRRQSSSPDSSSHGRRENLRGESSQKSGDEDDSDDSLQEDRRLTKSFQDSSSEMDES